MRILVEQAALFGALYGIRGVLLHEPNCCAAPRGATKFPFSVKMMVIGVVIHIFCVGLPIGLSIRPFLETKVCWMRLAAAVH